MIWRFDLDWLYHSSENYKLAYIGTKNSFSDLQVGCTIGSWFGSYAVASCEHVGIDYIRIALLVFGGRFYNITIFSPDLLFIIMSWVSSYSHDIVLEEGRVKWNERKCTSYIHMAWVKISGGLLGKQSLTVISVTSYCIVTHNSAPIALDSHDIFMLMVTSTLTSDSWSEYFDLEETDCCMNSCIVYWSIVHLFLIPCDISSDQFKCMNW